MSEHQRTKTIVTFDCGHYMYFDQPYPKNGSVLWCVRCEDEVRVKGSESSYKIRCTNCMYSAEFGKGRVNAEIAASKHRRKRSDHIVRMYNGGDFVRSFPADPSGIVSARDQTVTF